MASKGTPNIYKFVTDTPPKEVTKLLWEIKDPVSQFQYISDKGFPPLSLQFGCGTDLGLPSSWTLTISNCPYSSDNRLRLTLAQTGSQPEVTTFICKATLNKREGRFPVGWTSTEFCPSSKIYSISHELLRDLTNSAANLLEISVEFTLFSPNSAHPLSPDAPETLVEVGYDVLDKHGSLLENGNNSDFAIHVKKEDGDDEIMRVHKVILGARSNVFQKMLESVMKESETGTMIITDLSPVSIKIMLQYIYTGKLNKSWKTVPDDMVSAAHKYDLPKLGYFLDQNLHTTCNFGNAMKLRELAKLHGMELATRN